MSIFECGFRTNEEIAVCVGAVRDFIKLASPWIEAVLGAVGLGTFAVVSSLVWMLKRLRKDIESRQGELGILQSDLIRAKAERDDAQSRARIADRTVEVLNEQLKTATGPIGEALAASNEQVSRLSDLVNGGLEASSGDGAAFWSRTPGVRPEAYQSAIRDSKPMLLFANQKGGVGKTTLSANLAAAFADRGEKILVVDLDYQGSLTSLMRSQANAQGEPPSTVDLLFADSLPAHWPQIAIKTVSDNLHYISCWYTFERLRAQSRISMGA